MLFITLLYTVVFYQIIRGLWEQDTIWYKDPKFWLHIFTVIVLTAITAFN